MFGHHYILNLVPYNLFTNKTSFALTDGKVVINNNNPNLVHGPGNTDLNFILEEYGLNRGINPKWTNIFFKKFICWLLSGIIKFQMKNFPNTFDIKLFLTIIINIIFKTNTYNLHDIKFADFVNSVLNLNKLEDIKIFISFMFFKIYDFYWNPNIK